MWLFIGKDKTSDEFILVMTCKQHADRPERLTEAASLVDA